MQDDLLNLQNLLVIAILYWQRLSLFVKLLWRLLRQSWIRSSWKVIPKWLFHVIMGEIMPPYDIPNIMADIRVLAHDVVNIHFIYCNRKANTFADYLAKKAHQCNIHPIWII